MSRTCWPRQIRGPARKLEAQHLIQAESDTRLTVERNENEWLLDEVLLQTIVQPSVGVKLEAIRPPEVLPSLKKQRQIDAPIAPPLSQNYGMGRMDQETSHCLWRNI